MKEKNLREVGRAVLSTDAFIPKKIASGAIVLKNVEVGEIACEGLEQQSHEPQTKYCCDGDKKTRILTGWVFDEWIVDNRIDDKRNTRANVKVNPISPQIIRVREELLRSEEESQVVPDCQVIAHKEQNGECYNGKSVDYKVHGVDCPHVMRSSSEHSACNEHPPSVELENDSDEEVHEKSRPEQHREQPDGEPVEERVVSKAKRRKQKHVKGGLERVVPISESVGMNDVEQQEAHCYYDPIKRKPHEKPFHDRVESDCGPFDDFPPLEGGGGGGKSIPMTLEHPKKRGRKPKNRNGKRKDLSHTTTPKSLITARCMFVDCAHADISHMGYSRYVKRNIDLHYKEEHSRGDACFVCKFCGTMFCVESVYKEHVLTRCVSNSTVLRRKVVDRERFERNPYVRFTPQERLELLEKELLQFPQRLKEDRRQFKELTESVIKK